MSYRETGMRASALPMWWAFCISHRCQKLNFNTMKKTFIYLFLGLLIFPQITFASWWNPISWFNNWSFFTRIETKTEILEKRIKELESKMNATTTTSLPVSNTVTATTSAKKASNITTDQPKSQKPIVISEENFNTALSTALLQSLPSFIAFKDYIISFIGVVDNRIAMLDKLIVSTKNYIDTSTETYVFTMSDGSTMTPQDLQEIMLKAYQANREHVKVTKDQLSLIYLNKYNGIISQLTTYNSQLPNLLINRPELIKQLNNLSTLTSTAKIDSAKVEEIYTSFKKSSEESDKLYTSSWNKISNLLGAYRDKLEYVPKPIYLPVNTTRFTDCNISSYTGGGTINCFSY